MKMARRARTLRVVLLVGWFWLGIGLGILLGTVWLERTHAQSVEVSAAIHEAAATYGVSEGWMRKIAWCESRFTPWVTSRGGHAGLFQYSWGTWATMSRWAGYEGASPYDPWSASMVTAYALSHGMASHWACR